jgi:hypothetical protein
MLDARDKGFARKFFSDAEASDTAKGPYSERGLTAQAANLRLWDKTGRLAAGLSWSAYVTDEWSDGGETERLTLIFASRYVVLFGHHLPALVRQIDEGRLKSVAEVDGARALELMAENASIREESKKLPIVTRFEIGPAIADLVSALKGDAT